MKKYYLYSHDGSGNHGCEALVRSIASLLDIDKEHLILVSERPEEDIRYGIDIICTVMKRGSMGPVSKFSPLFPKAYFDLKIKKDERAINRIAELAASGAKRGDVALCIGGDSYCYGYADRLADAHVKWIEGGLKTVYWGCSIEPSLLEDPLIANDIRRFDLITARETISYEALKKVNKNTILISDSAFLLNNEKVTLPAGFEGNNIVGINTSPLVEECGTESGIVRNNYRHLIKYILDNTNMKVMFIPHVVWDSIDDRSILSKLYREFNNSDRIAMVGDCNCEKLKGYISKCRFFVGARTHSTIAAYSTEIPTLVVGYSVKARGIARDLFGTEDHFVLPAQEMRQAEDLTKAFCWMQDHEEQIKKQLHAVLPEYKNRVYEGVRRLKCL